MTSVRTVEAHSCSSLLVQRFPLRGDMFMRWFKAFFGFAFVALLTSGAAAQTTTGTISGRIVDSQGLALPGVTVTVAGPNLQGTLTAVSAENGDYIVPRVPPGTYTVTFELSGFERQQKPVDRRAQPGAHAERGARSGGADRERHRSARRRRGADQHAGGRHQLQAGVDDDAADHARHQRRRAEGAGVHPSGPNGSYSIAGSMSFESLYLVNGVNVNENLRGQANNLYIEDAVQETMVATDGISAEYGRFSGGVVNVITKSGGNRFSGSFRDTLYNDNWRAQGDRQRRRIRSPTDTTKVRSEQSSAQYEYSRSAVRSSATGCGSSPPAASATQPVGRNTVAPLNIPLHVRRQEPALRGQADLLAQLEPPLRRRLYQESTRRKSTARSAPRRRWTCAASTRASCRRISSPSATAASSRRRSSSKAATRCATSASSAPARTSTDLIEGTLLIDSARGNLRYWSPTFCGVCDPEKRDNEEVFVKAHLLPVDAQGRIAHVSRLRHLQRPALRQQPPVRQRLPHPRHVEHRPRRATSTRAGCRARRRSQYNPIAEGSLGTNFRTNALFFNDNWRLDRPRDAQPRPALGQEPGQGQRRRRRRRRQRASARVSASCGIRRARACGR